jgi:hypothetical protein
MAPSEQYVRVCPSSPAHRTLANRQIEIEGEGVPLATHNNWDDLGNMAIVHEKYGPLLNAAAVNHGVPYEAALAIATVEGGWKYPDRLNSAGAGGVMALMPIAFKAIRGYTPSADEMLDPETNIDVGVALIASHFAKYGELPAVAGSYNAGSPRCSESTRCKATINGSWDYDGTTAPNSWGMVEDCTGGKNVPYVKRVVSIYNSAIDMGLAGGVGSGGITNFLLFAVVAAVSCYVAKEFDVPKKLAGLFA